MSKIDRLKKQYPEMDISLLDIIAASDPSKTKKYVEFLIKLIKNSFTQYDGLKNLDISLLADHLLGVDNVLMMELFDEHYNNNRIRIKDISLYNTIDDIKVQVEEANKIVEQKRLEKQTVKLYNSKEWLVIYPMSFEASQVYANNTKWCITQKSYWNDYKKHSRVIYVINKLTDEKYAISKKYDGKNPPLIQGWDAKDNETSPLVWEFNDEVWKVLRTDLKKTKIEHELDELDENMIYIDSKNNHMHVESASLSELEWFYKKYEKHLKEPLISQVVERGKNLREEAALKVEVKDTNTVIKSELEQLYNDLIINDIYVPNRMEDYGYTKYIENAPSSYLDAVLKIIDGKLMK